MVQEILTVDRSVDYGLCWIHSLFVFLWSVVTLSSPNEFQSIPLYTEVLMIIWIVYFLFPSVHPNGTASRLQSGRTSALRMVNSGAFTNFLQYRLSKDFHTLYYKSLIFFMFVQDVVLRFPKPLFSYRDLHSDPGRHHQRFDKTLGRDQPRRLLEERLHRWGLQKQRLWAKKRTANTP